MILKDEGLRRPTRGGVAQFSFWVKAMAETYASLPLVRASRVGNRLESETAPLSLPVQRTSDEVSANAVHAVQISGADQLLPPVQLRG